jgi:hypothetical protein
MHRGADGSGAPTGSKNGNYKGNYKHGRYTKEVPAVGYARLLKCSAR